MLKISYINFKFEKYVNIHDFWLFEFIKQNIDHDSILIDISNNEKIDILICSCFGNINIIKNINAFIKIFFYKENLNKFSQYKNIKKLQKTFDLIIGCKYTNFSQKIIRLPIWMTYYPFYYYDNKNNILNFLQDSYNKNFNIKNKHFLASLVAKNDNNGMNSLISSKVKKYVSIICPGNFNTNTYKIGHTIEDKINFIKYTKYNICPENSDFEGYFTEKIFHALEAGCIPIYWAITKPEHKILNDKCYVWFDLQSIYNTNENIYNMIYYHEKYKNINLFYDSAHDEIKTIYNNLKNSILNLLNDIC